MKINSLLSLAFLACIASANAQFAPACVPHNGLQAYWPLDNVYAGNDSWASIPGTVYGASLAPDRFGNANRAYYFNGLTDSIITLYAGISGTRARAVSFWVKSSGATPAVGMYAVTWGSNNPGERFGCGIDYPAGCTSAGAAYCTAAHPMLGTGTSDNTWHHYVFQFSGIAPNNTLGSIEIYQDALLVGPTTPSTTPGSSSLHEGTIINTINTGGFNVRFGKANYPMTQSLLTGYLDDIGIWNRMLDTCEIKRLYNCNRGCNGETTEIISLDAFAGSLNLDIFPNPSSDKISFKNIPENKTLFVQIIDLTGKKVQGQSISAENNSLDVSDLSDGLYIVEIHNSDYKLVRTKLIVTR